MRNLTIKSKFFLCFLIFAAFFPFFKVFALSFPLYSLPSSILPSVSGLAGSNIDPNEAKDVILDWRGITYAPYWYTGKILANQSSNVIAGVTFFKPEKDANNYYYRWLINETVAFDWTKGKSEAILKFNRSNSKDVSLRVLVSKFKKDSSALINKNQRVIVADTTVLLPIVEPEIGIYSFSGNNFSHSFNYDISGLKRFTLKAIPFFFNAVDLSELNYEWNFDGQILKGEDSHPDILELDINNESAKPQKRLVKATVFNSNNQIFERATEEIMINIK